MYWAVIAGAVIPYPWRVAYRGDDAGDALEAPTAEGLLEAVLGPNRVDLSVAQRRLHIVDRLATLVEHKKSKQERRGSVKIAGNLVVARGFPREDVGLWIEHVAPEKPEKRGKRSERDDKAGDTRRDDKASDNKAGDTKRSEPRDEMPSMQRIFGVEPVSLLERDGLGALGRLDVVAQRLRAHLAELAGEIRRAVEIGSGHALDKVLLADHGDHYVFYARRLFRDRARFAMAIHADGRIVVPEGKKLREVNVTSRFGVTVRGDYVRFADRHGTDLAKVSLPWLGPEDRDEVARRIGQLVDRS
ncbi:MAG TPA: hypothetical protein VIV11_23130 [Kofleriaceae bacterium]